MAKALKQTLTDIADAIRAKDGTSTLMTSQEMPARIAAIPSGGGGVLNLNDIYPMKLGDLLFFDLGEWNDFFGKFYLNLGATSLYENCDKMFKGFGFFFEGQFSWRDISFPNARNCSNMFSFFGKKNYDMGMQNVRIRLPKGTNCTNMFDNYQQKQTPFIDMSGFTIGVDTLFGSAYSTNSVLEYCNLENIPLECYIANLTSPNLNVSSFIEVLNNTSGTVQKFTVSAAQNNKLTQDDRDYIADAGFTLVVK